MNDLRVSNTSAPGATERVELVTKEFIPFGHVLEGFVILQKKKPEWEKEDKM
jgi:26S proteasome regulatory subunit N1